MIEEIIYKHLSEAMSVPVSFEVPESAPETFIVLEKTGSSTPDGFLETDTIAVQSYAATMIGAVNLNDEVKSAMRTLTSVDTVTKVSLNSDYNFTDTSMKRYRYQAVYDVTYYAR